MTWSWNKLSAAKWEDAWSERIAGNPNAVITKIKGGKTVRITVYCDDEEDALALKKYFGGTVREIKTQDWVATQKRETPSAQNKGRTGHYGAEFYGESGRPAETVPLALHPERPRRNGFRNRRPRYHIHLSAFHLRRCQIPQKNIMEHDGHRLRNRRAGYGGA